MLEAWDGLDNQAQLVIVGGGKERSKYDKSIAEKGYKNVVLIDFVDKKKIFEYYKASDLFVLPTREDIWGLVINEAMACGLPIITTDHCIAGLELVKNGLGGYIVPIDNSEILHDRIKQCLSYDLCSMSKNNLETIKDYTIEHIIECHIRDIDKVIVR